VTRDRAAQRVFLRINGTHVGAVSNDAVVVFVLGVAAGDDDVQAVARRLEQLLS
jgi:prophage maintenance system killer protein